MTAVSLTISEALDIALKSYLCGKFAEAEQICLKILSADPSSAATLNLLAVIHTSIGRYDAALSCYDRALSLRPDFVQALSNRGAVLKAMKRYREALESFDRALELQPDYVEVLNNRAGVLQELGRYDEALTGYDRALGLRGDHPETLNNRGVTLQALRRSGEALASYGAALALRPELVEALVNRGIALHEVKRFDEALADFDRALALRPDNADVLNNRGNTLASLGHCDEALASYDAALDLQPQHVEALFNRGVVQHRLGLFDEALSSYDRALSLGPDHAKVLIARGATLHDQRRFVDALASYDRAITLSPDAVQALVNRGGTLHELGRSGEALQSIARALALEPNNAEALTNRGVVLLDLTRRDETSVEHADTIAGQPSEACSQSVISRKLRQLEEALASHDAALALRPDYVEALANRGITLYSLMRFDESLGSYDSALALRPDHADAHFLRSLSGLVTGDFERGWAEYEWRRKAPSLRHKERDFDQPLWLGEDDLAGKTILLYSEQGFGDSIQFCRYAPLVAARGTRVIVEVEKPLYELMTSLAGVSRVVARGDRLPDFDFQCPLPSLPLAFKTRIETIPSSCPYLRVPIQAGESWDALLGPKHRLRIGLAWAGSAKHVRDGERSMRLRDLAPLLEIDATFVSLQKEVRAADAETLAGFRMMDLGEKLEDFSETAALISQLDLVVSVDTSVAHLAGALGKPVWILLTHVPDWRWLLNRDNTPWYPSARLFRQNETREWANATMRLSQALRVFVRNGR
jgi:tetratricopeptide (TPR) repeat protein